MNVRVVSTSHTSTARTVVSNTAIVASSSGENVLPTTAGGATMDRTDVQGTHKVIIVYTTTTRYSFGDYVKTLSC